MKKGFTLIELLAVILILGIIALIAIPKVSDVIEDSKKNSQEVSKENYIKAVQDRLSLEQLKGGTVLEGTKSVSEINNTYPNLVTGDTPTSGTVTISNGKVTEATFEDDKYTTTCTNNKCEATKSGNENYVYFQEQNTVFSSLDQTTTTRPTAHKAYLKIDKNDITKRQTCLYDNGKELCLNNNEYEISKQKIFNYFGFNENTWRKDDSDPDDVYYYKDDDQNTTCNICDSGNHFICYNSFVGASVDSNNRVSAGDMSDDFGCNINSLLAECGDKW